MTNNEIIILLATRSLMSRYRRAAILEHMSQEEWDEAKACLISKKLLRKNGSITPQGSNIVGDVNLYHIRPEKDKKLAKTVERLNTEFKKRKTPKIEREKVKIPKAIFHKNTTDRLHKWNYTGNYEDQGKTVTWEWLVNAIQDDQLMVNPEVYVEVVFDGWEGPHRTVFDKLETAHVYATKLIESERSIVFAHVVGRIKFPYTEMETYRFGEYVAAST